MFEMIIAFAVGILILCLVAKLISLPLRLFWKFITNSIVGAVMLWVVNLFGASVPIDILRALIAGVFGIPGVICILLYQYLQISRHTKSASEHCLRRAFCAIIGACRLAAIFCPRKRGACPWNN